MRVTKFKKKGRMEQPDLEIVVSWNPNDCMLEPDDGRELQILDRIIAAKDRERVLDKTKRPPFVPFYKENGSFTKLIQTPGRRRSTAITVRNQSNWMP
jgi:hypothetical protein